MMPFAGEPMLVRVVRLLSETVGPIVVVAAPEQELPELPLDVTIAYDRQPDRGPLEALAVGLGALAGQVDRAFVIACDTPLLAPAFVERVVELSEGHDVAVPSIGGVDEPLVGIYSTGVLEEIESLLTANRLRPAYLFDHVKTRRIAKEELTDVDPELLSLLNVNKPADYDEALSRVGIRLTSAATEPDSTAKWKASNEDLCQVASFATRTEADLLKWRLEAAGIRACLADEALVGWFWYYANAVGGIKVLVTTSDLPRALELLAEFEREGDEAGEDVEENWTCGKCGAEVEGNLDTCWSCGTTADGRPTPDFELPDAPIIETDVDPPAPLWSGFVFALCLPALLLIMFVKAVFALPWPASHSHSRPPEPEPGDYDQWAPILRRACLAAILSYVSLPVILNVYSMWLIIRYKLLRREVRQRVGWYVYSAIAINMLILLPAAVLATATLFAAVYSK